MSTPAPDIRKPENDQVQNNLALEREKCDKIPADIGGGMREYLVERRRALLYELTWIERRLGLKTM